jgi:hypothetical protein
MESGAREEVEKFRVLWLYTEPAGLKRADRLRREDLQSFLDFSALSSLSWLCLKLEQAELSNLYDGRYRWWSRTQLSFGRFEG